MSDGVNDHTRAYRLHSKKIMCLIRQGRIVIYGYGLRVNPRVGPGRVKILATGRVRVRLLDHGSGRVEKILNPQTPSNLAYTNESCVCGRDADLSQITLTTCHMPNDS